MRQPCFFSSSLRWRTFLTYLCKFICEIIDHKCSICSVKQLPNWSKDIIYYYTSTETTQTTSKQALDSTAQRRDKRLYKKGDLGMFHLIIIKKENPLLPSVWAKYLLNVECEALSLLLHHTSQKWLEDVKVHHCKTFNSKKKIKNSKRAQVAEQVRSETNEVMNECDRSYDQK